MINNFLKDTPDGIIAYQSLLFGMNGKEVIGNAFLYKSMAIYIMYDYKGRFKGEEIQFQE